VKWIKKGVAREQPIQYASLVSEMGEETISEFQFEKKQGNEELDKYDLENYDREDGDPIYALGDIEFKNNVDDPYITDHDAYEEPEFEDLRILPDDLMLIAAVSEDEEVSHLDFYVYQKDEDNMYPHHDYLLPSFPLCVEWFDFVPGSNLDDNERGNMVAVGTFEPFIEIWNLDIVDQGEPTMILGAIVDESETMEMKELRMEEFSHTDAILSMSWNKFYRNVLATGSGDCSVKIWDLANAACIGTFRMHTDKVQSIAWNPAEATVIATGGFDRKVNVFDIRNPSAAISTIIKGEIENLVWLPQPYSNNLLVSDDHGNLYCFDIYQGLTKPLWEIQAHNKPTQTIATNTLIPGFIATGSPDTESPIKLWDITSGNPICIHTEVADLGPVFSLNFSEDDPFLLVLGTRGERPTIFNVLSTDTVQQRFGSVELVQPTQITTPLEPFGIIEHNPEPQPKKPRRKNNKKN
jgi:periodic tryptophan protein 1